MHFRIFFPQPNYFHGEVFQYYLQVISVASKKAPREAAICGNIFLLEIRRVRISGATLLETRQNVLSADRL